MPYIPSHSHRKAHSCTKIRCIYTHTCIQIKFVCMHIHATNMCMSKFLCHIQYSHIHSYTHLPYTYTFIPLHTCINHCHIHIHALIDIMCIHTQTCHMNTHTPTCIHVQIHTSLLHELADSVFCEGLHVLCEFRCRKVIC